MYLLVASLAFAQSCDLVVECDGVEVSRTPLPGQVPTCETAGNTGDTGTGGTTGTTGDTGDGWDWTPAYPPPAGATVTPNTGILIGQSWVAGTYHTGTWYGLPSEYDTADTDLPEVMPEIGLWAGSNEMTRPNGNGFGNPHGVAVGFGSGPDVDPGYSLWMRGAGSIPLEQWLYGTRDGVPKTQPILDYKVHRFVGEVFNGNGFPGVPDHTIVVQGHYESKTAEGVARRYDDLVELLRRQIAWSGDANHALVLSETLCTACAYTAELKIEDQRFAADYQANVLFVEVSGITLDADGKHPADSYQSWLYADQVRAAMSTYGVIP